MHPYCPLSLHFGPDLVRAAYERIDPDAWDRPTHPDRFTPRQVLCHLAFWEPVALARMRLAEVDPGAAIDFWDEDGDVEANQYDAQDPYEMLARYQAARAATKAWLDAIPSAHWTRGVVHPQRGPLTIDDLANFQLGHDLYHLAQLEAARRLDVL